MSFPILFLGHEGGSMQRFLGSGADERGKFMLKKDGNYFCEIRWIGEVYRDVDNFFTQLRIKIYIFVQNLRLPLGGIPSSGKR